jgi:8-oxo-dGTP diphosphatase
VFLVYAVSMSIIEDLPDLPSGYHDTSDNSDKVCIEDYNGSFVCDIMSNEDAEAARYALAKWALICKSRAEGLFSVAALIFNGPKVLAVSRKNNHADLGLAGGKIEPGESPTEALVRELREETGLTALGFIPIFEDWCRVENGKVKPARVYLVYSWEGEPTSMENAIVEWVLPERLFEDSNSFCGYNKNLFQNLQSIREIWKSQI